ncbi:MAG TPA: hypothetical protein EYH24_02670 [Thermococcus paralvinellae]|uniref:Uncharacterized protein n=1 Tax=Thermococcus paralvinellae TaxID=582419 RepID=A0A832ZH66_9EURY|nr:hypothetical protein [Thermococcus paralvinellae]
MHPSREMIEKILFGGIVLLLGALLAQTFVVGLSLLSIVKGINIPFLIEKITTNKETIFRATPILLVLSYSLATIIAKYSTDTAGGAGKIGELRVVKVIVIILAISVIAAIFGSIVSCGYACPVLACHGAMESCTWEVGLLSVKYVCNCIG